MWLIALLMASTPAEAAPKSSSSSYTSWKRPTRLQLIQYRRHVANTSGLDKLKAKRNPIERYDFGMVNITLPGVKGSAGLLFVRNFGSGDVREDWFFTDALYYDDPGAEFDLTVDSTTSMTRAQILSALQKHGSGWWSYGWHGSTHQSKVLPGAGVAAGFAVQVPMIEPFSFDLLQNGVVVGGLHREAHLDVSGNPTKMVDHYYVYDSVGGTFDTLVKAGDQVQVRTALAQHFTTTAFLNSHAGSGPDNYVKVEYDIGNTTTDFWLSGI
ncbi:MAG: hypothetical protein AB8H79_05560 [Myxococcota bacterium]